MQYRIEERKFSDGIVDYTIQKKVFGLFWVPVTKDVCMGVELQRFRNLTYAEEALEEYEAPAVTLLSKKHIYSGS